MTMKYTLTMSDDGNDDGFPTSSSTREVSHTITGEQTWPELLLFIQEWLHGVGFIFDGELTVVNKDGSYVNPTF